MSVRKSKAYAQDVASLPLSEYNGYERFIAEKMCSLFTDEDIRFYCIGGSGTLFQTLSGMDDAHNRQIACYPCGLSNDFLKCYVGENRGFRNIENLLDGRVDKLDYIKVSNTCKAIDFVSIGVGNSMFETDSFLSLLSYTSSTAAYGLGIFYDRRNGLFRSLYAGSLYERKSLRRKASDDGTNQLRRRNYEYLPLP